MDAMDADEFHAARKAAIAKYAGSTRYLVKESGDWYVIRFTCPLVFVEDTTERTLTTYEYVSRDRVAQPKDTDISYLGWTSACNTMYYHILDALIEEKRMRDQKRAEKVAKIEKPEVLAARKKYGTADRAWEAGDELAWSMLQGEKS